MATNQCVEKNLDTNGTCVIKNRSRCKDTWCDANNAQHGAYLENVAPEVVGPWTENATDQQQRHSSGWNNQFAFPWEIGLYWNISVGGIGQRAVGCPGLDTPFGTVAEPNWPFKVANGIPIFASPAMDCNLNTDAPDGKPMHQVVDELASDNEYFAEMFLEGWQLMTSNGYTAGQLRDGPHSGWMGHYSLAQQGVIISDFEAYIQENAPVTFTDPSVNKLVFLIISSFRSLYFRWILIFVDIEATPWSPAATGFQLASGMKSFWGKVMTDLDFKEKPIDDRWI